MLGVRRQSVTVAAGLLQQAGLISYRRGIVTILDRERLEESACEDYRFTREIYERMYRTGPAAASPARARSGRPRWAVPSRATAPAAVDLADVHLG